MTKYRCPDWLEDADRSEPGIIGCGGTFGWVACIAGKLRTDNPYKRPFHNAWDSYRRDAWDSGWCRCERGERWVDPRKA